MNSIGLARGRQQPFSSRLAQASDIVDRLIRNSRPLPLSTMLYLNSIPQNPPREGIGLTCVDLPCWEDGIGHQPAHSISLGGNRRKSTGPGGSGRHFAGIKL